MLWRLFRRKDIRSFREEGCWAIVEFPPDSGSTNGTISNSIASELLCNGFNVLLVGKDLEHIEKSLASSHPDRRVAVISNVILEVDDESTIYANSLKSLSAKATLVVLHPTEHAYAAHTSVADDAAGPNTTLRLLRMILPNLRKDREIAVVVAADPLSFYSEEHDRRLGYYEAFINTLSQETRHLKLDNIQFLFADCHSLSAVEETGSTNLLNPSSNSYAKSILKSVGCGHTQIVPYWPHEFLGWVLWLLLLVFPRSAIRSLEHRVGL